MDIRKLQRAIIDGLEDVKAQDILVFNTEHLTPLFERVIIASGTSNRHTKALAASVRNAVREAGLQVMRTEGEGSGEWIIVDCAAAVVHVMQPAIRQYYKLEEIWGDNPIKVQLKALTSKLVKASEPEEEEKPAKKRATGKKSVAGELDAPVKKVAAKKTVATKTSARSAAKVTVDEVPAKKVSTRAAAKKVPAKKAAVKKELVVPTVPKTLVVNQPMSRKVAGKKVAAKKVVARKVAAKKVAAKKVPAKKVARTAS